MGITEIEVSKSFVKGKISSRLFGSFIEHMGSVIYTGIYEPNHAYSDDRGFRQDVLDKIKHLELDVIRYPGGNFTSGYDWMDTVGPVEDRPRKIDLAWRGIEPNTFGLNEFFEWIKEVGAEPILTVNLGTKGIDEARNLVEYCNFDKGTYWSDLRISHGAAQPHGVKLWCLGNELDGPWQIGAKSAYEYGRLANETSKVMKMTDDKIETILVGSSTPRLASYPEWDRIALEQAYDNVDYLALHNYIDKFDADDLTTAPKNERDDTSTYLAKSQRFDQQIEEVIATCDYVKAYLKSKKTMYLAFDEWNVHNQPEKKYENYKIGSPIDWCYFTMEDTLLFGSLGLSILRHADRVKIACQSLLVNTIPLILTDENGESWCNPTYYVMEHLSKYARGEVLEQKVTGPTYNVEKISNISLVDSCVVNNIDDVVIFLVNRSTEIQQINFIADQLNLSDSYEHIQICHDELSAKNTRDNPNNIIPREVSGSCEMGDDMIVINLIPYSWNVIKIKKKL